MTDGVVGGAAPLCWPSGPGSVSRDPCQTRVSHARALTSPRSRTATRHRRSHTMTDTPVPDDRDTNPAEQTAAPEEPATAAQGNGDPAPPAEAAPEAPAQEAPAAEAPAQEA